MAGKTHPYIKTAIMSTLVFVSLIFVIVFLSLYVRSVAVDSAGPLSAEQIEKNLTAPGKIYPRP